jgi:hypothetical protein
MKNLTRFSILAFLFVAASIAHAAVTVNGSATAHSFGSTIGSGVASTFAYTAPAGTIGLVMIETSDAVAAAVPTAFSYNGVAATLISNSFSNFNSTDQQSSMWYLPSPTTGTSLTVSITYTQSVAGGAVVILVPLLGVSTTTPFQTTTSANNSNYGGVASTALSVTPPAATSNDLYIGVAAVELDTGTPTLTVGSGTQLTQTTSRGSLIAGTSMLVGNGGSLTWTLSVANPWSVSAVAFLAPTATAPSKFSPFGVGALLAPPPLDKDPVDRRRMAANDFIMPKTA